MIDDCAPELHDIRARFERAIYREHALKRLIERRIPASRVREAIFSADAAVIEDNRNHRYGPQCLILGWCADLRPLHVRIGLSSPLWIITVYDPSIDLRDRWEADFRTRRPIQGGSDD